MAAPSSTEVRSEISRILTGAELSSLSSKKVRKLLEKTFKIELSSRKKEIDNVLMEIVAERETLEKEEEEMKHEPESPPHTKNQTSTSESPPHNGSKTSTSDSPPCSYKTLSPYNDNKTSPPCSDKALPLCNHNKASESPNNDIKTLPHYSDNKTSVSDSDTQEDSDGNQSDSSFETPEDMNPPVKKAKKHKHAKKSPEKLNDEELARKLQEEDMGLRRMRHRPQRKAAKKAKKTTQRSRKGVKTGYIADMLLSPELADIMGTDKMSRSDVVKKMWQIIKERELSDPKNKQYHFCDDQLLKVFRTKRVRTFSMMKYLKRHIKDPSLLSYPL